MEIWLFFREDLCIEAIKIPRSILDMLILGILEIKLHIGHRQIGFKEKIIPLGRLND